MGTRLYRHQIFRASVNHLIRRALWSPTLVCALALAGCATSATERPATSAREEQSLDSVLSLTYLCEIHVRTHDELGTRVAQTIEDTLINDGFKLVRRPDDGHDAVLKINVSTQQEQSILKVYVNGRVRKNYRVSVTLSISTAGRAVEHVATEFSMSEDVPAENINGLVTDLGQSRNVASLAAQKVAAKVVAKSEVEQQAKRQAERERVEQESAWKEADPESCHSPTTLQACIGVRLYLSKYPDGGHADEAKRVLDIATPKLDLLQKDDSYWIGESNFSGCAAKHSQAACEGVELYVTKYPKGLHCAEAAELLRASGPR